MTWEQWQQMLASRTHGKRLMTLEEMANVAAFMASDKASGMTGTTVNLTMGRVDDLGLGEGRALCAPPLSAQSFSPGRRQLAQVGHGTGLWTAHSS